MIGLLVTIGVLNAFFAGIAINEHESMKANAKTLFLFLLFGTFIVIGITVQETVLPKLKKTILYETLILWKLYYEIKILKRNYPSSCESLILYKKEYTRRNGKHKKHIYKKYHLYIINTIINRKQNVTSN